jgi:hypothetical protein
MSTSGPGRPREFKYKMRQELIKHIAGGATIEEAALIVGVSIRTVQREAKHNEHFHHDLELARYQAPVDPELILRRAARCQWRAAAWLLERKDPDLYARRPASSCAPHTVRDVARFLIEKALELVPPEQHEAAYLHLQTAADRMIDVIMPDNHIDRRRLVDALMQQTTPLTDAADRALNRNPDYERAQLQRSFGKSPEMQVKKLLGAKRREPSDLDGPPRWRPSLGELHDSQGMDAPWHFPTAEEEEAHADRLAIAAEFNAAWAASQARAEARAQARRDGPSPAKATSKTKRDAAAGPETEPSRASSKPEASAPAAPASADFLKEGIMSPKLHEGDRIQATEFDAIKVDSPKNAGADIEPTKGETAKASREGEGDPPQQDGGAFVSLLERFRARRRRDDSDGLKQAG